MKKLMHKDIEKLAMPALNLAQMREALSAFAKSVVKAAEKNEKERERIRGEMRRGSRAGKGQFHL